VSVHVYEYVYFGSVFGAIFFLNLSLVGASLLVAAICGTSWSSTATRFIIGMIVVVWAPLIVKSVEWTIPDYPQLSSLATSARSTPFELFWLALNTSQIETNITSELLRMSEAHY
jgi:hypothetical protein